MRLSALRLPFSAHDLFPKTGDHFSGSCVRRMIFSRKPVTTFRDHALPEADSKRRRSRLGGSHNSGAKGRREKDEVRLFSVILRCERSEPRRMSGRSANRNRCCRFRSFFSTQVGNSRLGCCRPSRLGASRRAPQGDEQLQALRLVIAGLDPAIHAESHFSMDHRVSPVVATGRPATANQSFCRGGCSCCVAKNFTPNWLETY
jgi:hypothetical protein